MTEQVVDPIQEALDPIVKVSSVNGQLQVTLREGTSGWEALGALETALVLIKNTYVVREG